MIKPEHIPDEVIDELWKQGWDFGGKGSGAKVNAMQRAIATALNAWPGMEARPTFTPTRIILPLQEKDENNV